MTRVYFVRHAQPEHDWKEDRTRPLTEEGKKDSAIVLDFLKDKKIEAFYCSPYKRSMDTIADAAAFFGKEIITDERLREREKGPDDNNYGMFRKRWEDHDYHEEGGESIAMVQKRNVEALNEILSDNTDKEIVIGTHGTALSTILNFYDNSFGCEDFLRIIDWMPYIIELDFEGDKLVGKYEHCHIEKEFKGEQRADKKQRCFTKGRIMAMQYARKLRIGDKVAIVSLSSGMLGEEFCSHNIEIGVKRLKEYGLEPVFMPNALKGIKYLKENPQARARDLKAAFLDDSIAGIICAIGGDDTYRLLPYLMEDEEFIEAVKNHPKLFTGFSDTTVNHLMFYKLGLSTYYGSNFICDLGEIANEMLPYTKKAFEGYLEGYESGEILSSDIWYEEREDFSRAAIGTDRISHKEERGFELLQGNEIFQGELLGGCLESLYDILTNSRYEDEKEICERYGLFPDKEEWKGKILFIETCEEKPVPELFEREAALLKAEGVFDVVNGVLVGKPQDEAYYQEYKDILIKVIDNEELPIVYNVNFGHATPRCALQYGAVAKVDMKQKKIFVSKTLNADFGDIVEYVPDAEIWDLYNENRELLGRDHVRGEQLPIDGYHLVVHVWIRNSKGEYLISQRSANRPTFPLMWECVDGSVLKGEDSLHGALREVKEEVGVDLIWEKGQVVFSDIKKIEFGKVVNKIVDVWLFEYDGEVDLGNATTDEVAQVAWMNREQIKELFEQKMFVDTLEYFFTEVDKQ